MKKNILIALWLFAITLTTTAQTLIQKGTSWYYLDDGSFPGDEWFNPVFDDSEWSVANAAFGYGSIGDFGITTLLNYGGNINNKFITTYFRKEFDCNSVADKVALEFTTLIDDGAVVYLNGIELYRINMDFGTVESKTLASATGNEGSWQKYILWTDKLKAGTNLIAVELHQSSPSSSDLCFDLELKNLPDSIAPKVKNIHFGSANSPLEGLAVTWQSEGEQDSIKWGYTSEYEMGIFPGLIHNRYFKHLFSYTFPNLNEESVIYYSIYNSYLQSWSKNRTFNTSKAVNTNEFSFTVLGDSRTYYHDWHTTSEAVAKSDFSLFVGDIVSVGGSAIDWENWFHYGSSYSENNLVYHAIGNHDVRSGGLSKYKDLFVLPRNKYDNESFYSFEFGNAAFICLDSETAESRSQYVWLLETLEKYKNKTWKIVWFHRPFYTSPAHAGEMDYYFSTWWQAFDDYGVDLIFNGHTHNYQRTKPINRNVNKTGPVANYGSGNNQGRCQVVAGSAGAPQYGVGTGWFIEESASIRHYCLVEIKDYTLQFTTKTEDQNIIDSLSIIKEPTVIQETPELNYRIYPNPARSEIIVDVVENNNIDRIEMYDITGNLVLSIENVLPVNYLDLTTLNAGIYHVCLVNKNKRYVEKVELL